MRKTVAALGLLVAASWIAGAGTALATLPLQKKAKEAGFAAANCLYCHNEKLPKKGGVTHNDRGKWLVGEKDKRKVKDVDPAWLKDYVEPKK